jgi:hypothetical protein
MREEFVMTLLPWRAAVAFVAAAALAVGAGSPQAATPKLQGDVLIGPAGADLIVALPTGTTSVRKILVSIYSADPAAKPRNSMAAFYDVPVVDGHATVGLGVVARGSDVGFEARYGDDPAPRNGRTTARLRPDLRVVAVHAPPQTLTSRRVDVVADIEEALDDTGATATLTLLAGGVPIAALADVEVGAGADASPVFEDVLLDLAARSTLTVRIEGAAPAEYDVANNEGTTEIDVTEHELVRSSVLLDALGGFGAHFNQHVYAPVTNPPVSSLPDFEAKVVAFGPDLVRVFYNDNFEERQPNKGPNTESFYKTLELAQETGAVINVTYQATDVAKNQPSVSMATFADRLETAVKVRGVTNLRWVTVGNEPNATLLTLEQYEALNRALDAELVARGLREQIRFMVGDLVRDKQRPWFQYIAEHMNDLVDAWSVHIYWNYWETAYFGETRLKDVRLIVTEELPPEARKPTYVMEYAVRGAKTFPGLPTRESGYWADGTEMARTNVAAFQQLWFGLNAAQLGFTGAVKWEAYWGKYTSAYNSLYAAIGPAEIGPAEEGWPLFPTYHSLRLLFTTTARGWQVLEVAPWEDNDWVLGVPDSPEKEIVAFAGTDEALTFIGLDSNGAQLNGVSPEVRSYSIGGLPENATFTLALWNAAGDGLNTIAGPVPTNENGVARFEVPLHAAFALTNVPVS